jgi:hypothetical protein
MAFLVNGAVLLRSEQSPLLFIRAESRPQTGNHLCFFRDLETSKEVILQTSEVIHGCEEREWEILKRSHPVMPSGSVDTDHSNHEREGCKKEPS